MDETLANQLTCENSVLNKGAIFVGNHVTIVIRKHLPPLLIIHAKIIIILCIKASLTILSVSI